MIIVETVVAEANRLVLVKTKLDLSKPIATAGELSSLVAVTVNSKAVTVSLSPLIVITVDSKPLKAVRVSSRLDLLVV